MNDKDLRAVYPIAWVTESSIFTEFIKLLLSSSEDDFFVADFASGEYDRVPSFFTQELPKLMKTESNQKRRTIVYCTDIHALRLDSLSGKLEEAGLLDDVRVVQGSLEKMDVTAKLRPSILEYLEDHPDAVSWLDDFLIGEECLPPDCFDIGVLNNDVIGYLFEYYTEYSDAEKSLQKVWNLMRSNGLLIVTMPCLQYKVDNISVLEKIGFNFLQGIDINLSTGTQILLEKNVRMDELSKLGHYTFLIFSKT